MGYIYPQTVGYRSKFMKLAPKVAEFGEIMQNNSHYVVQSY